MKPRTSETHPIYVCWIDLGAAGLKVPGRLGVTLAPGKHAPSYEGASWARDLDRDLDRLRHDEGAEVLVPLLEDRELEWMKISELVPKAEARGMSVHRLPIVDGQPPAEPGPVAALTATLAEHLQAGRTVVVHCRGGLGRAGTIAACTLVQLGLAPEPAMRHVRTARPGAIENRGQEDFVRAFRPR